MLLVTALSAAAPSQAATVSKGAGTITFAAGAGETNVVTVSPSGASLLFKDTGVAPVAGAGCAPAGASQVSCATAGASAVDIQLGNQDDSVSADAVPAGGLAFTINGGLGGDVMTGSRGSDAFVGGGGFDWVDYSARTARLVITMDGTADDGEVGENDNVGADITLLMDGSGNDSLTGNNNTNFFYSGDGNDTIYGLGADDLIGGFAPLGAGNDELHGGDGDDLISGGAGNDVIDGGANSDIISDDAGIDTVSYLDSPAGVTFSLASNAAQNTGGAGIDTVSGMEHLTGSTFDDSLVGTNNDETIEGAAGTDTINAAGGIDTASYGLAAAGVNVSLATAGAQNTGGAGTDTLSGFENLTGSTHDDTLEGTGADNAIDGAAGSDAVSYLSAPAAVNVSLAIAAAQNTGGAGTDTLSGFENLTGSTHDDTLAGTLSDNVVNGAAGTDSIGYLDAPAGVNVSLAIAAAQNTGGAGTDTLAALENVTGSTHDDTLEGTLSDNVINGAAGTDRVQFLAAPAGVTIDLSLGASQNTGAAGTDTFAGLEILTGSNYDDTLSGTTGDDTIEGADGADTIDGRAGTDTLRGAVGDDVLRSRDGIDDSIDCGPGTQDVSKADAVPFDAITTGCESVDRPASARSDFDGDEANGATYVYEAADGQANDLVVERIFGKVKLTDNGTDANGDPIVIGPPAPSGCGTTPETGQAQCTDGTPAMVVKVYLGDGNDRLTVIDPGNDIEVVVHGGAGNDTLTGGPAEDFLYGEAGNDTLIGLGDDDNLDGGSETDDLDGGPGADTIAGGADGEDTVGYEARANRVVVSLDDAPGDGEQNENDNVKSDVETVVGSAHDDTLIGSAHDDTLIGGLGNDTIQGLAGGDQLADGGPVPDGGNDTIDGGPGSDAIGGGQGNDTLDGGQDADTINGGDGIDLASFSSRLAGVKVSLNDVADDGSAGEGDNVNSDVENVTSGQGDDVLAGSSGANALDSGIGEDRLSGGEGTDTLNGRAGDDILDGGGGGDALNGQAGRDEVTYAAAAGPVGASLDGGANDGQAGEHDNVGPDIEALRGGPAGDTLIGDARTNVLIGGGGNDALGGGGGIDFISGGEGDDALGGDEGADTINGDIGNDAVDGGGGNDALDGGEGGDTLVGAAGLDTLAGGSGPDTLRSRDGEEDLLSCGGDGSDSVDADAIDQLSADCAATVEAAAVSLAGGALSLKKKRLSIRITCLSAATRCDGALALTTAGKVKVAKRRRVKARKLTVGRSSFAIAAGSSKTVNVTVSRAGRKALQRTGKLSIVARVTVRGGQSISKNLTLRGKRKGAR